MTLFKYTALDSKNSFVKGKIEAKSEKKAIAELEKEGFLIVNINQEKTSRFAKFNNIFKNVTRLDIIFFTRHLYTMMESGIALDQAVKITSEQVTNLKFKEILLDIYQRLQKGQSFYNALSHYDKYFSSFYINLIRVGEMSGKLDEVLSYLLDQLESDYDLKVKARGAMIYPSIIVSALFIMVIFMMVFVVPKISSILKEYDVELPLATRILIGISDFLLNFGLLLIPVIIILVIIFRKLKKTPKGKWRWDSLLLKIPQLNQIIIKFNLARFARSLNALLMSGVSIDVALKLSAEVSSNSHYQKSLKSGVRFIEKGIPLAEVLKGYPTLYPAITLRMIEVGEKSGKLTQMLKKLADFYEKSVAATMTNLASVIEPFLLLFVGLAVAFVAVSVLTPIWKFTETI
ncbi:MAG: hypothetical protein COT24_02695 [Candidatus Kerfeldbacteria bacterium CG08_land_8_20_14_0_20_40_16]|uniref:Type II secretion system protein GspF domain-containing protein n=1 Tax=Candidatus Kerfeldbacteria bacterium CG08_land_8_20_14_0_20_40_16 TaxID=2014244 RepID=A0A2H0YVV2_9BACT|nr:MAG: hypothetical protein COT24_02695 [Candidatus Kerfeldbacteria bacterium CG08_land_8_20_14_0_20_40_16]